MSQHPWRRIPFRGVRKPRRHNIRKAVQGRGGGGPLLSLFITLVVAGLLFLFLMIIVEKKLQPMVSAVAKTQISNMVTHRLEQGLGGNFSEIRYEQLITIERDQSGNITALTTNMGEVNRLRAQLVATAADSLEQLNVSDISIPLGSLFNSGFLWAHGPTIRVRAMSVANISAEFKSQFISAGVNQTLHRIWLEVSAPMTVLLPSGPLEVLVNSQLCMAETVIVGHVPETYFQMGKPS